MTKKEFKAKMNAELFKRATKMFSDNGEHFETTDELHEVGAFDYLEVGFDLIPFIGDGMIINAVTVPKKRQIH